MLDVSQLGPEALRPLRRTEYERLVELGCFQDERVELLYGMVVRMSPKGPLHESALQVLTRILVRAFSDQATVRIQSSFAASDRSEPEPDVAVVPNGDYRSAHPDRAFLIIEVAHSSLATDRGMKARLYAESGVPGYWVVNVADKLIEVFTEVVAGAYTRVTPFRPGEVVRPLAFPDVEVQVGEVLR
jgi:Uma2 family endonuclease